MFVVFVLFAILVLVSYLLCLSCLVFLFCSCAAVVVVAFGQVVNVCLIASTVAATIAGIDTTACAVVAAAGGCCCQR